MPNVYVYPVTLPNNNIITCNTLHGRDAILWQLMIGLGVVLMIINVD